MIGSLPAPPPRDLVSFVANTAAAEKLGIESATIERQARLAKRLPTIFCAVSCFMAIGIAEAPSKPLRYEGHTAAALSDINSEFSLLNANQRRLCAKIYQPEKTTGRQQSVNV